MVCVEEVEDQEFIDRILQRHRLREILLLARELSSEVTNILQR